MTFESFLEELKRRGIDVAAQGGELRLRGPRGALTPELRDELQRHKAALLGFLADADAVSTLAAALAVQPADVESVHRLTPLQAGMVAEALRHPASSTYFQQLVVELRHLPDADVMAAAFRALRARHPALRCRFVMGKAGLRQVVLKDAGLETRVVDLRRHADPAAGLAALGAADRARGFDVLGGDLFRLSLVALPEGGALVWSVSHALVDGWSLGVLHHELAEILGGRGGALPPPPSFAAFVDGHAARDVEAALEHWHAETRGLRAPTNVPRDVAAGARPDRRERTFVLDAEAAAGVRAAAAAAHVTPAEVVQAAWALVLARLADADDVVFGLTVSGRPAELAGVERAVGLFINTVPVRLRVAPEGSARALLRAAQDAARRRSLHDHVSLADIQGASPLGGALLDHVLVFENQPPGAGAGLDVVRSTLQESIAYDLGVVVAPHGDTFGLRFLHDRAAYSDERVDRLYGQLRDALLFLGRSTDAALGSFALPGPAERQLVVQAFNDTSRPRSEATSVVDVFEAQVLRTPSASAVAGGPTYAELDADAARVAARLGDVATDEPVALLLPRSPRLLAAILGVMKRGGAYLPLGVALPDERLQLLLRSSGVRTVVTDATLAPRLAGFAGRVVDIAAPAAPVGGRPRLANGSAYVIHTSGSTGEPKGVVVEHAAVVNRLAWMQRAWPLAADDVVLFKTPYTFDVSVWEIFWWAFAGAAVAVLPDGHEKDPAAVVDAIERDGVTTVHFVPSMLMPFLEHVEARGAASRLSSLRRVFASGEALDTRHVATLERVLRPACGAELVNLYGPTEATVDVSVFACAGWEGPGTVPIGVPIDNLRLHVLGRRLEPLPVDSPGEIYIGGAGVARGYRNAPHLTAERFVPDPFGAPGDRLYRTGDVGRWDASGRLHYLGRADLQVKVRGHRVELGEVETLLLAVPGVRQAAVVAAEVQGATELWAFVAGAAEAETIRRALRERAPDHLVPSRVRVVEDWPLGSTGKTDRRALLALGAPEAPAVGRAAADDLERRLAGVFAAVLGLHECPVDVDFFALGGHSLKALEVVSRVHADLGVELRLADVFAAPTVAGLAGILRERAPTRVTPIPLVPDADDYAASDAQRRLWLLSQWEGGAAAYNVPGALRLEGRLDADRLARAWDDVVARHEVLRTQLRLRDGELRQVVGDRPVPLEVLAPMDEAAARAWVEAAARAAFDLEAGPLVRAALLPVGAGHVLFLNAHHAVWDGASRHVVLRDLAAAWSGALPAEPRRLQHRDVAAWQRALHETGALDAGRVFWREALAGAAPLDLPADRPRPATRTFAGGRLALDLPSHALLAFARTHGVTPFVVLTAAVKVLLHRLTGARDVCVGTPVAGRDRPELADQVGVYVNTLVLRDDVAPGASFRDTVLAVRRTTAAAVQHRDYPFDRLVEELGLPRDTSRSPLFDVMVTMDEDAVAPDVVPGVVAQPFAEPPPVSKFDLTFAFARTPSGLAASLEWSRDLFDDARMARLARHLQVLLTAALAAPDRAVRDLPLVEATDDARLLALAVSGEPGDATDVVRQFAAQVARTPDAPAVRRGASRLSYADLDRASSALGARLRADGVGTDARVALALPRGERALVAILAVLKAGGAFVPLDVEQPRARLARLVAASGCHRVLVDASTVDGPWPCPTIAADGYADAGTDVVPVIHPRALAYVIFTSGSTGEPKGCAVEHASLAVYLDACRRSYAHEQPLDMALLSSLAVDLTVTSLLLPLVTGGCVHVFDGPAPDAVRDALAAGVAAVKLTPSHVALLSAAGLERSATRLAILGGEVLGATAVATLRRLNPSMRIVDEYGPTETTVGCVAAEVQAAPGRIGRPVDGARVYVLDPALRPAPLGVPGEIWIGGAGVARGYLDGAAATAERFVADPFAPTPGARMYRSGDLGRWDESGALDYLGRADAQVKIRGHRVEPGEIEETLRRMPDVRDAAVVAVTDDGGAELRAFVAGSVSAGDVRAALAAVLPDALVPARLEVLDDLPRLASGKIDRRALRSRAVTALVASRPPRGPVEEKLAAIFADVLGVAVGAGDDFFAAGGHSLKALQVVGRVQAELGVAVRLSDVFRLRTVEALAAVAGGPAAGAIPPAPPSDDDPVSDAQRRLWVLSQWDGGAAAYNVPAAFAIEGPLDVDALRSAIAAVVARHDVLRTRYLVRDGELRQRRGAAPEIELRDAPADLAAWLRQEAAAPFVLEGGPLVRLVLLRERPTRHVLFLNVHHSLWDGESARIFARELAAAWSGGALPPARLQYRDYAVWQRARDGGAADVYWQRALADLPPPLDLPADRARPPVRSFRGGRVHARLDGDLVRRLEASCRAAGATPFLGAVALVKILLHRLTGAGDLLVATPVSGRDRAELQDRVGLFVNTVVLRDVIRGSRSFRDVLDDVRATAQAAFEHADHPFDRLVDVVGAPRDASRAPVADVAVAWEDGGSSTPVLPGLDVSPLETGHAASRYDLALAFAPDDDGWAIAAEYAADLFDARRIEALLDHLQALARGVVDTPDAPIAALPMLATAEREKLASFEQGGAALAAAVPLHVAGQPEATAVVDGDTRVTYADLASRSTALARALVAAGVRPEDRVAVCVRRGVDLVVALLATWKAGAAYVPLDVALPPARQEELAASAGARVVIARDAPAWGAGLSVVAPDASGPALALPEVDGRQAAYVLFTSGSTGTPRGVVVPHAGFVAMAASQVEAFGLQPSDRVLQFASAGFDASLYEIALALASGATLVVAPDTARSDATPLRDLLRVNAVTVAVLPPSFLHVLGQQPLGLRLLVTAGEAAIADDARQHARSLRYVNAYGPTEFSVCATLQEVTGTEDAVTIGRAIPGISAYVLDAAQGRLPAGVVGELWLGGVGAARGYLDDPALTAERFRPDPFSGEPGARMYRTGDRACWSAGGQLEYHGRGDLQLKVRGHRVEPGEIEAALLALDGVREAAVVLVGDALVAYVAGETRDVRTRLRERLPEFMVPSRVHALPALPRLASGKADRRALAALRCERDGAGRAPDGPFEQAVARVFAEVLGTATPSADADFFALGGHSLRAMQVVARLRTELRVALSLPELFTHPSIEALAALLGPRAATAAPAIERAQPAADDPVTDAQRRLWVLSQWDGASAAYNVPGALRLRGAVDVARLAAAVDVVAARHDVFRTRFLVRDGSVRQVADAPAPVLEVLPPRTRAAAEAWIAAAGAEPFVLERGPLVRVVLLPLDDGDHVLFLNAHHAVWDAHTQDVVVRELAAVLAGTPPSTRPLQMRDVARWQERREIDDAGRYWRGQLAALQEAAPLPSDRPRPARPSFRGGRVAFELDDATAAAFDACCARHGATAFMGWVAATQVLLHRLTGDTDVRVGAPLSGRTRAELSDVAGLLVNTLVLRTRVRPAHSFDDVLDAVRATAVAAYAHGDYPFDRLVEEVGAAREAGRSPLFDVVVTVSDSETPRPSLPGLDVEPFGAPRAVAKFDLTVSVARGGSRTLVALDYVEDLFDHARMEALAERFAALLRSLVSRPAQPVGAWSLAGDAALAFGVGPHVPRPEGTVLDLVEDQARRRPQAVAVVDGAVRLTYGGLDASASELAARLGRDHGIGLEDRVGVALPRGASLVVTLLAVWKAGGVFVPLDVGDRARWGARLADAGCRVLVSADGVEPLSPAGGLAATPSACGAAYLIYTSGTTGEPNGVVVEHRSLANIVAWHVETFGVGPESRGALFASPAFDASVWELWPYLAAGAAVVVLPDEARTDLATAFRAWNVTHAYVPSVLAPLLAAADATGLEGLTVLTGGEALPPLPPTSLRLVDNYGPTEATVLATSGTVRPGAPPSLGRAIDNVRVHVLDGALQPAPVGVPGEIWIGGAGVARGYAGRPDLTAARFQPDPWSVQPGARMYRTGDRGSWRSDGSLEFLGRVDRQVKVRGHRVEPGEVERLLQQVDGVRAAAVVPVATSGATTLRAFVAGDVDADGVRRALQGQVPAHLVPSEVTVLDEMPLRPSGKVDHAALLALRPEPSSEPPGTGDAFGAAIARVFTEVLGRPAHDFFAGGGHSLAALQVVARLRHELHVEVQLADLFASPSAHALAAVLRDRRAADVIPFIDDAVDHPASDGQRRLWVLSQWRDGAAAYNVPGALRLDGALDAQRLGAALDVVVRRHEVLRTRLVLRDGELRQVVRPDGPRLETVDVGGEDEAARWVAEASAVPFELDRGPLLRAALLRLGPDRHVLFVNAHHAIWDGASQSVFLRDLAGAYDGTLVASDERRLQFRDVAAWERERLASGRLDEAGRYWRRQLAGEVPALELPADRPRPATRSFRGGTTRWTLEPDVAGRVKALCAAERASVFAALVAAVKVVLHRHTGARDVWVGTPASARLGPELADQIGLYANTLVLRDDVDPARTLRDTLGAVRETVQAASAHREYPFDRLVDELAPPRDTSRSPLFDVMVTLAEPDPWPAPRGLRAQPFGAGAGTSKFDLTFFFAEDADGLTCTLEYATDLFEADRIERLGGHVVSVLRRMGAAPETRVGDVPLVSTEEAARLASFAAGPALAPPAGVLDRFASVVARTPSAVAVACGPDVLTYAQLDAAASDLAARLAQEHGAGVERRVAIALPRGADTLVGILGVLKTGAAFVPLDVAQPAARLRELVRSSGCVAVVADDGGWPSPRVRVEREGRRTFANAVLHARSLAYVIHTSGSTGAPKACTVEHGNLAAYLEGCRPYAGDMPFFTSPAVDLTLTSLLLPLTTGHCVHVVPELDTPLDTLRAAFTCGARTVKLTPTHVALLPATGLRETAVEIALVGGEALPWPAVETLRRLQPRLRVVDEYGPTETTVGCVASEIVEPPVRIGRPLPGTRAYVLDPRLAPAPLGVAGEVWIGGDGVGRGYLGAPDATADRWRPDPFGAPGSRMYRTGDRGRWSAHGELEYLGRADRQLKIRGHRVEPGEVEAALRGVDGVRDAAVEGLPDATGVLELAAFVASERNADDILADLRARLPEPCVPSRADVLEELPATSGGKVDRRALRARPRPGARPGRGPGDAEEAAVAGIFRDVLGVEAPVDASFFALGGHSLRALQVVARVQSDLGAAIGLAELFARPTVAALAALVRERRRTSGDELPRGSRGEPWPATDAQRRMWLLSQWSGGSAAYNVPAAVELDGPLDAPRLRRAFRATVARHDILRARFELRDGELWQVPDAARPELEIVDVPAEDAARWVARESARPFALDTGPLLRAALLRLGAGRHVVFLNAHHTVWDAGSQDVFARELAAFYGGGAAPEAPHQHADVARWQRARLDGGTMAADGEWWRRQLADDSPLELPADRPRPAMPTFRGGRVAATVPVAPVRALASRHDATLFMVVTAAVELLLYRLGGKPDVRVGTPVSGRDRRELESVIGPLLDTVVLCGRVSGRQTFGELLRAVRRAVLEAFERRRYPFDRLVEELAPVREPGRAPLFDVMVTSSEGSPAFRLDGLAARAFGAPHPSSKVDLTFAFGVAGDELVLSLEYSGDLFDAPTAQVIADRAALVLEEVARDPGVRVAGVPLGDAAEALFGRAGGAPRHTLLDRFEEQVARRPEAVAVEETTGARLTYAELDRAADGLARVLVRDHGVGPESRVGLALTPGGDLVVGLLAIWKAGGAYVPLDPAAPAARLESIAEDAGLRVVVTSPDLHDRVPAGIAIVDATARAEGVPLPRAAAHHAAYVLYTSGTTGRPRGVVVEHGSAARLFDACGPWLSAGAHDVWTVFHSFAFDFSVWEIHGALAHGGRLVIVPPEVARAPDAFHDLLVRHHVTVLSQTPSAFAGLAEVARERGVPPSLRLVVFGGEALVPAVCNGWVGGPALVNMYGITETTVHVTQHVLDAADVARPASVVGRPLGDLAVYLLDRDGTPVPAGVTGEIHVAGPGVARGYLGLPATTAERFVPDPFSGLPGARMYRSGDLARRRDDGTLEYLGRADAQVKVRGHRVEPGEVEAALLRHPAVAQAVVTAEQAAEKVLVGHVVLRERVGVDVLRAHAAATLPPVMVPSAFVVHDAMPATATGKVDRRALTAAWQDRAVATQGPGPRTLVEERVRRVFADVLGVPVRSVRDDFFALGGSSLSAVRLAARLRHELGAELPLAAVFQHPTVEALARRIALPDADSCVVTLRGGGDEPPVVLVHPAGGTVLCYADLLPEIGAGRPVLGVQHPSLAAGTSLPGSLDELAAAYADTLAPRVRDGCVIAGWSSGGMVALALARALQARGVDVRRVVTLDTPPPGVLQVPELRGAPLLRELLALPAAGGEEELGGALAAAIAAGVVPDGFAEGDARRLLDVYLATTRDVAAHRPEPGLPVLAVSAEEGASTADGWTAWGGATVQVATVPGDHRSLLRAPNVSRVAALIERG